jgi:hypothetical protein
MPVLTVSGGTSFAMDLKIKKEELKIRIVRRRVFFICLYIF